MSKDGFVSALSLARPHGPLWQRHRMAWTEPARPTGSLVGPVRPAARRSLGVTSSRWDHESWKVTPASSGAEPRTSICGALAAPSADGADRRGLESRWASRDRALEHWRLPRSTSAPHPAPWSRRHPARGPGAAGHRCLGTSLGVSAETS